jgi:hypothetical protein
MIPNRHLLENEIGDINVAIELMIKNKDISNPVIEQYKKYKATKINKYLHYNEM